MGAVKGTDKRRGLSGVLLGICAALLFGGGLAVCILAGSDYYNMGIPLGVVGLILCILNIGVSVGKKENK